MTAIRKFFKNESGATAIEYGLIAALVSVAACRRPAIDGRWFGNPVG